MCLRFGGVRDIFSSFGGGVIYFFGGVLACYTFLFPLLLGDNFFGVAAVNIFYI
jgi:hypothetical protein